jgi:hypothetical protein
MEFRPAKGSIRLALDPRNPVRAHDAYADFVRTQHATPNEQRREMNADRAERNKRNAEAASALPFVRVRRADADVDPEKAALYREQDARLAALRERAAARPVISSSLDTPLHAAPTTPPSQKGAIRAARLREVREASASALPFSPASQPPNYSFRPTP